MVLSAPYSCCLEIGNESWKRYVAQGARRKTEAELSILIGTHRIDIASRREKMRVSCAASNRLDLDVEAEVLRPRHYPFMITV